MSTPAALLGIAFVACLMSVAVFGSLFRTHIPGLRRWSLACAVLLIAIGALLFGKSDAVVFSASASVLIGSFLVLQGFRQFFFLRPAALWEYVVLAAILAALVLWVFVAPNLDARVVVISAFLAYIRYSIAWLAYRYRPPERPVYGYYFVLVVALLGALVHTARAFAIVFGWVHQAAFLEPTPINVLFISTSILSLPCLGVGMMMLAHDRLAGRMERLATVDDLTGVLGRRAFIARAEALLMAAKADGSKLAVAILDIDHFKGINDRCGHAAGDEVLAHVARLIAQGVVPHGVVGRIGGEEFAVLFTLMDKARAAAVIEQVRAMVAVSATAVRGADLVCTLSAGVEENLAGDTLTSLMARADTALYAAKANGRNCVLMAPAAGVEAGTEMSGSADGGAAGSRNDRRWYSELTGARDHG